MALAKCKECNKDVAKNATTCPHCGVSNPATGAKEIFVGVAFMAAIGWAAFSYFGDTPEPQGLKPDVVQQAKVAVQQQDVPVVTSQATAKVSSVKQIKPETFVRFPESSAACMTKEGLLEVVVHFTKREVAKGNSYFLSKDNPEGQCVMLDTKKTYKVLSAEYNNPDTPEIGLIEVVAKGAKASVGGWTFTLTAKPVN